MPWPCCVSLCQSSEPVASMPLHLMLRDLLLSVDLTPRSMLARRKRNQFVLGFPLILCFPEHALQRVEKRAVAVIVSRGNFCCCFQLVSDIAQQPGEHRTLEAPAALLVACTLVEYVVMCALSKRWNMLLCFVRRSIPIMLLVPLVALATGKMQLISLSLPHAVGRRSPCAKRLCGQPYTAQSATEACTSNVCVAGFFGEAIFWKNTVSKIFLAFLSSHDCFHIKRI